MVIYQFEAVDYEFSVEVGITVTTLDGSVGMMTHILDRADPERVIRYLCELKGGEKGVPTVLSGGRDGISENLRDTLLLKLPLEGYVIKGTDLMGPSYGRIASLDGTGKIVNVLRTHNQTKMSEVIPLMF